MSQYLEKLIRAVPGVVYQFRMAPTGEWNFPYLSDGVRELYEFAPEAVYADASIMLACVVKADGPALWRSLQLSLDALLPWVHEFRISTPSGAMKWVRGQAMPERLDDGAILWSGILVDISALKTAEMRLLRLQKLYAAVIEANRLISRTQSHTDLFSGICRIAVELGGMKMAWIGVPNEASQQLDAIAMFGDGIEILRNPEFYARFDVAEGRGQAATAFSESRVIVNQDFLRNPNTRRWSDLGQRHGFGSSASFPIRNDRKTIAVLTVYRADIRAFDTESVDLLDRLSSDISHAVTALSAVAERKHLEEALRFRQFGLDQADEEIFWVNQHGRVCEVNETAGRLLGYSHDELLRLCMADIDPALVAEQWQKHWRALKRDKILRFESTQRTRDGRTCPTEVVANYFEYQGVEYSCMLVRNITELKIMEQALAESQGRFNLFMDTLPAAVFIKESDGSVLYANRYMSDVIGARHWMGKSTRQLFPSELAERMIADDRHALDVGYHVVEEQVPTTDGVTRTYQTHKFRIERPEQAPILGGIAIDISEHKAMEEKIRTLAYFDSLTNLPNRRMLLDRLTQALSRARRHHTPLAVMFLDLDYFKNINDLLGHDVGDALLKVVSARLTRCVRTGDTVSRHGGDEFIILLAEIAAPEDAALVAEKIINAINAPIQIECHTLNITTSIGIAVCRVDSADEVQDLLKKADAAMYAAKDEGRNGYQFFRE
ncbi:diguanylate cyclase domain-containing protein [Propionivibrio dicarboxylicus]|uniref:PAS domain S-box-containing protein/diguanylate cyclase (GGDEF) domain-containing protein n=1 Tax=Propionivibrio dicarboxylicus TaxID=83767 RepID=A0A1G8GUT3_9RHOO|nr:diguanylate cyclase [Propionivibrio dicarboxylicus]SDH98041.1 PAS domain S-box-containing protein/diguanylate cyclase (GGDEF) domain-containing protein [Propionivibrio dicarboxylicus]